MSSKFNPQATKKTTVPWCTPPPEPALPPEVPGAPTRMIASCAWVDHYPGAYCHHAESFGIFPNAPGEHYAGSSAESGTRLSLTIDRVPGTHLWNLTLTVYDPWRTGLTFDWTNVAPNRTDPFELHPPAEILRPAENYRKAVIFG